MFRRFRVSGLNDSDHVPHIIIVAPQVTARPTPPTTRPRRQRQVAPYLFDLCKLSFCRSTSWWGINRVGRDRSPADQPVTNPTWTGNCHFCVVPVPVPPACPRNPCAAPGRRIKGLKPDPHFAGARTVPRTAGSSRARVVP